MGEFLLQHGYTVLFAISLIAQLGLPVPLTPLLLAAGVLAKAGQLSLVVVIGLSAAASALGHLAWYEAGRRRGTAVLRLLCRISIEPDSCVRRTEDLFARHGGRAPGAAPLGSRLPPPPPPPPGVGGVPGGPLLLPARA